MAELARDIMSMTDPDARPEEVSHGSERPQTSPNAKTETPPVVAEDSRAASFDLVIGPAH
jgi:hypothetical protein